MSQTEDIPPVENEAAMEMQELVTSNDVNDAEATLQEEPKQEEEEVKMQLQEEPVSQEEYKAVVSTPAMNKEQKVSQNEIAEAIKQLKAKDIELDGKNNALNDRVNRLESL